MKPAFLGSRALLLFAFVSGACGDDGSGTDETGNGTTGADTTGTMSASMSTTLSTSATMSTSETDTASTGSGSGESSGSSGSDTDSTGESSGSGSSGSDSSGSSSTGATVGDCAACGKDEVCVENQAFESTFACVPIPEACEGEADCDCAAELCQDPFVACDDQSGGDALVCICIAC